MANVGLILQKLIFRSAILCSLMLTFEVVSLFIHYLISIWTTCTRRTHILLIAHNYSGGGEAVQKGRCSLHKLKMVKTGTRHYFVELEMFNLTFFLQKSHNTQNVSTVLALIFFNKRQQLSTNWGHFNSLWEVLSQSHSIPH